MITNITLENFKCFRSVSINPKLVTLFIGPNGTGKSGVLQALLLLKQARGGDDGVRLFTTLRNGSPAHLMVREPDSRPDSAGYQLSGYWPSHVGPLDTKVEFDIHIEDDFASPLPRTWGSIEFNYAGQTVRACVERGDSDVVVHMDASAGAASFTRGYGMDVIRSGSIDGEAGRHDLREVCLAPIRLLGNMRAVPAARGLIREAYKLGEHKVDDLYSNNPMARSGTHWPDDPKAEDETNHQKETAGLGQQEQDTVTTLAYSSQEVARISEWMKRVTGVGFRTDLVPPQTVMPVSMAPVGDVKLIGEGFGTNALVQLLFELARAVEGATILMEEPEIHLHPKAQAEVASVIVEEAKASNKQVIMTTHSEHIAGRLLTLLAERTLSTEELAIYSFEKDEETGVCSASEIEVTPRGQVKGGLKSFFETHMDEMRRHVDALRAQE